MRKWKYKFRTLGKEVPKTVDLNIYTYLDRVGQDDKIEWAQVGTLEKLEVNDGVQLGQEF